ncbi:28283_t:CDS:2, partial [Dentiscutata erythropus]
LEQYKKLNQCNLIYNIEESTNMINALKLLHLKSKNSHISNENFEEILKIFNCNGPTLYSTKKFLQNIVNIDILFVDMCINSCIAFTGEYIEETQCPICFAARFREENVPFKTAAYYPLIPRLRFQYANLERSKTFRYRSNYIFNTDRFYHLHFVSTLSTQISPPQPLKQFHSRQVVWIKDGEEELWAPSLDYILNNREFIALSNFYYANLKEPILELNDWGVKYAKFRTREGYMLGSLMSKVAANARDNSCVLYELEVNIAKPREAKKYELQQFFGRVQFYFYYMFRGKYQLFAYIQNAKNARKGLYGLYSFEEFGDYEFVDVSMLRRCVGFMK